MEDKKWFIKKISEPTIEIDEISLSDLDLTETKSPKTSEMFGRAYPGIVINEAIIKQEHILKFEIDQTGFRPRCTLKMLLGDGNSFLSLAYPKDGDILSVYISGRDDIFTSVRLDFLITDIPPKPITSNKETVLLFHGVLNIPGLDADVSLAKQGTSFNVLKEIATELGLGFSTNESETDDDQIWISPNISLSEFIREIADHAWKDETSFYDVFIDIYYTLNFINLTPQLSHDLDTLIGLQENTMIEHRILEGDMTDGLDEQIEAPVTFTNQKENEGGNFYFNQHKIINRSSEISRTYGYKFNTLFYELNTNKEWDLPIEALVSEDRPDDTFILKGRGHDDSYKKQTKQNWAGIQYSTDDHNMHPFYIFAKPHNHINLVELDKLNVMIILDKMNLNIQRFGRYPLQFWVTNDPLLASTLNEGLGETDEEQKIVEEAKELTAVDKFYTGYYMLHGLKIKYNNNRRHNSQIYEELFFTRREWPTPL